MPDLLSAFSSRVDRFIFAGKVLELVRVREMTAWVRRASSPKGAIPRWMGTNLPISPELGAAVREQLDAAAQGILDGPEMEAVAPVLRTQAKLSAIPARASC